MSKLVGEQDCHQSSRIRQPGRQWELWVEAGNEVFHRDWLIVLETPGERSPGPRRGRERNEKQKNMKPVSFFPARVKRFRYEVRLRRTGVHSLISFLLKLLQFLSGLKPNCLTRRDSDLCSGSRISANPRLARPHVEDPEPSKFDPFPVGESALHAVKHSFHRHLSF